MTDQAAGMRQRDHVNRCLGTWLTLARQLKEAAGADDYETIGELLGLRDEVLRLLRGIGPPRPGDALRERSEETARLWREIEQADREALAEMAKTRARLKGGMADVRRGWDMAASVRVTGGDLRYGRYIDDYR